MGETPKVNVQEVVLLARPVYLKLEALLPQPVINPNTTDLQAGYALGVQRVLQLLREGYVV